MINYVHLSHYGDDEEYKFIQLFLLKFSSRGRSIHVNTELYQ